MHHVSIDRYASSDGPLQRLDARAKLAAALVYTAAAVSEPRREVAGLFAYLAAPVGLVLLSGVPVGFIAKRVLALSPFAAAVALFNPLFETAPVIVTFGPWEASVRLGWVTAGGMFLKFLVSVLVLLLLATTTRFSRLAWAASSFGVPRVLAAQVSLLYRLIFLVVDEFERARRAAMARAVGRGIMPVGAYALAGLFARSFDRAERVGRAMRARGFDGSFADGLSGWRMRAADLLFLAAALALTAALRLRWLWI